MNLEEIYYNKELPDLNWIIWENNSFKISINSNPNRRKNRETLAHVYSACVAAQIKTANLSFDEASKLIRAFWIEEITPKRPKSLPRIIGEDGFLRLYALGLPLSVGDIRRIFKRIEEPPEDKTIQLEPLYVEWNDPELKFYDINPTPPGFLPKIWSYFRLKKDEDLLNQVSSDLAAVSLLNNGLKRKQLSLALLGHGAAYRELDGKTLWIADFTEKNKLVAYKCQQHLLAEGVKTISLIPQFPEAPSIYLCQGTELWPSQPSVLGSILANFATHGSATEAYAHSWRLIHKHLRELPGLPIVAGHSMGGSLAIQIGLYSHSLIQEVYAFNPPMPNERDYLFYHQLASESKEKIRVITNLDDFAFWRIGSKVIGNVTVYLGKVRWKYHSIDLWDCLLLVPAFIKFFRNVRHAFPAHQNIAALYENWVSFRLTQEEIEKENIERTSRFDYLRFFPKLYDPMKSLVSLIRRIFKWRLEKSYLRNEIELLILHEKDLIDTMTPSNRNQIIKEIRSLRRQKGILIKKLLKIQSH